MNFALFHESGLLTDDPVNWHRYISQRGVTATRKKKRFNHKEPSAAKPQPKKTFNRKERKGRKEEGTNHEGTKDTKGSDIYTLKLRELRAFVVKNCLVKS